MAATSLTKDRRFPATFALRDIATGQMGADQLTRARPLYREPLTVHRRNSGQRTADARRRA